MNLKPEYQNQVRQVAKLFPEIEQVVLFGSRSKGDNQEGSDIDLAVKGAEVTFDTISCVHQLLGEESQIPLFFDVVDYQTISNENLREHIDRVGQVLYEKEN